MWTDYLHGKTSGEREVGHSGFHFGGRPKGHLLNFFCCCEVFLKKALWKKGLAEPGTHFGGRPEAPPQNYFAVAAAAGNFFPKMNLFLVQQGGLYGGGILHMRVPPPQRVVNK